MDETELARARGTPSQQELISRLEAEDFCERCGMASSRNRWFQEAACPEYVPLAYVTRKTAVLRVEELPDKIANWQHFLADIKRDPSRLREATDWTGYEAQEVFAFFRRATPSRRIHQELTGELHALFSFMKSQPAALQLAYDEGCSVLCLQIE